MTTWSIFQHHLNIQRISRILIFYLIASCVICQNNQNFTYFQSDSLIVLPNNTLGLSTSLTTTTDQYLSQSQINIITNHLQTPNNGILIFYNFLYFNLSSQLGMQCYQNWVLGTLIPNEQSCQDQNQLLTDLPCLNYSQCFDQQITYQIKLSTWENIQNLYIVQNPHFNNTLHLQTELQIILISSNLWFFLGVGLTCLLLIMIVILTGLIFYWALKYKRTKKIYDQYKLTIDQIDFKSD